MKIIVNLSGEIVEREFVEPRGVLTMAQAEPAPGVFTQILLGSAGLIIKRRDTKVAIPLNELLRLASEHEPALTTAKASPVSAREPALTSGNPTAQP